VHRQYHQLDNYGQAGPIKYILLSLYLLVLDIAVPEHSSQFSGHNLLLADNL